MKTRITEMLSIKYPIIQGGDLLPEFGPVALRDKYHIRQLVERIPKASYNPMNCVA